MDAVKKTVALKYTYSGIFGALLFAFLSFTPSLLPRGWVMQGVLTGISMIFGYGLGNAVTAIYRYFDLKDIPEKYLQTTRRTGLVILICLLIWFMGRSVEWNNEVLGLVGLSSESGFHPVRIALLALVVAQIILIISRMIRGAIRTVIRYCLKIMPLKLAQFLGIVIGTIILLLLFSGVLMNVVMTGVNNAFSVRDGTTDEGVVQPESPQRSGSSESLVSWDTLGRQGRKFTGLGPKVEDLNNFSGGGAKQPIRVYVGLKSADSVQAQADLALEELKRTGAFEREVLVLATTTGTGWLDPGAVDTVEYVHNGDTAIVGLQYSYLPSWISLFVDQQITMDTARATLETVHGYWTTLDQDSRPEIYLFGLSLGSFGSQNSINSLRLVNDPIDGALWAGPTFFSEEWINATEGRDEGSPAWQPIVDDGRVVRFTGEQNDLDIPQSEWGNVRYVYLQHATDPITFFSPDLLFNSPDWLIEGQRGPDISSKMEWYPGVTFWQVAADLPMAGAVPNGHGHAYSPASYIDSWAGITEPDGWSEEKADKLKTFFNY